MAEQHGSDAATRANGANGANGVATVSDPESLAESTHRAPIKKNKRPSRKSAVIGAVVLLLVLSAAVQGQRDRAWPRGHHFRRARRGDAVSFA
jgi:hypothetical protein